MILRGIDFGSIIGASGMQGMFGEGYPFHSFYRAIFGKRFSFDGVTFTAKTVTLNRNEGNMPLKEDGITPVDLFPECIHVSLRSWLHGAALNAVGLSNFGAEFYFDTGRWQDRRDSFFLSFMAIGTTPEERLEEWVSFLKLFMKRFKEFRRCQVGIQVNRSCPNVGLDHGKPAGEEKDFLDAADKILSPAVPIGLKFNVLADPMAVAAIAKHDRCDAIFVSNTLPWGSLPDRIDWEGIFGSKESPLKKFKGGGGMSGKPLLPLVIGWLDRARGYVRKPIVAGGGVLGPDDMRLLSYCHPDAASVGSVAILRPWRLASTICEGQRLF
ncbi:MAG: hypothetical protein KGI69_00215 [Patescibacteria group bacterium]|nr:hypothetical protein [Patescibacteria group bacterium]